MSTSQGILAKDPQSSANEDFDGTRSKAAAARPPALRKASGLLLAVVAGLSVCGLGYAAGQSEPRLDAPAQDPDSVSAHQRTRAQPHLKTFTPPSDSDQAKKVTRTRAQAHRPWLASPVQPEYRPRSRARH